MHRSHLYGYFWSYAFASSIGAGEGLVPETR